MEVRRAERSRFERVYSVVVLVKGVDGAVELLLGLVLLVAPAAVATALTALATELGEGSTAIAAVLAAAVEQAGDGVTSGVVPIALFLLVHGVVKLATVYCLLRRLVRWYPWAIAVLLVLLAVQSTDAVLQPTAGAWVLAVLDVAVLVLVVLEYRRLRTGRPRVARAAGGAGAAS